MFKKRVTGLIICCLVLLFNGVAAKAQETGLEAIKEEAVYAVLAADGSLLDVYVVNIFEIPEDMTVSDHGRYTDIRNLTDTAALSASNDTVSFAAKAGLFYYQGTLTDSFIPWIISISYALDGSAISAADLAGGTGKLEIRIKTAANPLADPVFYDHYLLQVSVKLDANKTRLMDAGDGTTANAGNNKQITYTVLPGQEGDCYLLADVWDFTLEGIDINAVPYAVSFDMSGIGELIPGAMRLADAVNELTGGAAALAEGAASLADGLAQLAEGSGFFKDGAAELGGGGDAILEGSAAIKEALDAAAEALSGDFNISALALLPTLLNQLSTSMDSLTSKMSELQADFDPAMSELDAAITAIPTDNITAEDWAKLYASNPDGKGILDLLSGYYDAAVGIRDAYPDAKAVIDATNAGLNDSVVTLRSMTALFQMVTTQLNSALDQFDINSLSEMTDGLAALAAGYGDFHEGLEAFLAGYKALTDAYTDLHDGITESAAGAADFSDGLAAFSQGVEALNEGLAGLPELVDGFSGLLSSFSSEEFTPVSFVSPDNANVRAVQFVMKTQAIEKPAQVAAASEPEAKATFLSRLLDLFR